MATNFKKPQEVQEVQDPVTNTEVQNYIAAVSEPAPVDERQIGVGLNEVVQLPELVDNQDDPKLLYNVPKTFRLCLNHGIVVTIPQGLARIHKSWGEHFYAKANGVKPAEE